MVADGYKDTEIGVIPIEWDVVKLETICDVRDGTHDSPKYQETGIPFITSKHLTDKGVDFSDVNYISNEDHINFSKRSLVENGDILFGMIGTIGKPLIVNYDFEFSIKNVALLKFKDNTQLNNSFTLNLLKSTIIDKQFSKLSNGGVQSFIALGMIRSLKIPLPPLKEQEKIADILSTADDKIDAIAIQIDRAETLKQGLLQKLLSEGIGHSEFKDSELRKIPESWEVVELDDISNITRLAGYEYSEYWEEKKEGDILALKGYNIGKGKIINRDTFYISNKLSEQLVRSKLFIGDVVFPVVGTIGNAVAITENDKYHINQNIAKITPYLVLNSDYLVQFLMSVKCRKEINRLSATTSQPNVLVGSLRKFRLPLPPLEEQKQIADILSTADEKLEVLRAKKEKYETLKKGLLQKLLSGEVRV